MYGLVLLVTAIDDRILLWLERNKKMVLGSYVIIIISVYKKKSELRRQ